MNKILLKGTDLQISPVALGTDSYGLLTNEEESFSLLDEFFSLASTKKYTNARIRRAVISSLLKVREADIKALPAYTSVLASNKTGLDILKEMKKSSRIPVITKPADYKNRSDEVKSAFEKAEKAYAFYSLSQKAPASADEFMKFTPIITN